MIMLTSSACENAHFLHHRGGKDTTIKTTFFNFCTTYERASVTVDISLIQKDLNGETDTSKITGSSESD
jgi:hypothetical protein